MPKHIEISLDEQKLWLKNDDQILHEFSVSTAKNGAGEMMGSECTPRGLHEIEEMVGADEPINSVFVGRKLTGEMYTQKLRKKYPDRDWILTRILRLSGCEPGGNKGGQCDSHDRLIYIHGTPDDVEMGKPGSHGCVRLRNENLIVLFDQVTTGMKVLIT